MTECRVYYITENGKEHEAVFETFEGAAAQAMLHAKDGRLLAFHFNGGFLKFYPEEA